MKKTKEEIVDCNAPTSPACEATSPACEEGEEPTVEKPAEEEQALTARTEKEEEKQADTDEQIHPIAGAVIKTDKESLLKAKKERAKTVRERLKRIGPALQAGPGAYDSSEDEVDTKDPMINQKEDLLMFRF